MAIPGYRFLLSRSLETRTLGENLLTQIDGVFYLLSRPMLLLHTNIDPDLPARTHWTMPLVVEAVVLLAILTVAVWQWRRRPWLGLGLLWPFAMLLATNSVLPRLDVANDRQLYLALVGPTWVVAMLLLRVPSPKLSAGLTAAVAGVLLAVTAQRNGDYRTEVSLWEATAKVSPGKARVWNNLGFARQTAGDLAGARTAYERALALDPEDVKARINLGTLDLPERPASVPRP
jgi:tetratricopeptide (TPR) repeat protein